MAHHPCQGPSKFGGPHDNYSYIRGLVQADEKFKKDKFVLSVAFSPDGRRLACGVMDGTIAVFDVPSGKLLNTLTGHHKPVRDVCFTPGRSVFWHRLSQDDKAWRLSMGMFQRRKCHRPQLPPQSNT